MPTDAPSTPWLRRFHTAESGALRLFCFPHAGGNASFFHPFSARLTPRTEVLAVQYPGRQERFDEPRVEDLHELADLVAAELAAWAEEPFALFGHSMGATLAFEVGSRLHARGARPTALFVSGRRAPSVPAPGSVHLASDEKLIADMRLLGGTDNRMLDNLELLAVILPAVRSDYVATETYRYRGAPRSTARSPPSSGTPIRAWTLPWPGPGPRTRRKSSSCTCSRAATSFSFRISMPWWTP